VNPVCTEVGQRCGVGCAGDNASGLRDVHGKGGGRLETGETASGGGPTIYSQRGGIKLLENEKKNGDRGRHGASRAELGCRRHGGEGGEEDWPHGGQAVAAIPNGGGDPERRRRRSRSAANGGGGDPGRGRWARRGGRKMGEVVAERMPRDGGRRRGVGRR
jgi:hypothetical protein